MKTGPLAVTPRIVRTHLSLFVRDPFTSAQWYVDVLGMEETARGESHVFLSFGRKHHDIALIKALEGAERGDINMQHYGLEIEGDVEQLRRLYGALIDKGVPIVKTTDHAVGLGVYFEDPDGHRFEFFCETVTDDDLGKQILGKYNAPSNPIDLPPIFPDQGD